MVLIDNFVYSLVHNERVGRWNKIQNALAIYLVILNFLWKNIKKLTPSDRNDWELSECMHTNFVPYFYIKYIFEKITENIGAFVSFFHTTKTKFWSS